jgi:hypothetical protein
MRATTILAIVAIVAALGAVTSLTPVQQVSAAIPNPNFNAIHHACQNGNPHLPFPCVLP